MNCIGSLNEGDLNFTDLLMIAIANTFALIKASGSSGLSIKLGNG